MKSLFCSQGHNNPEENRFCRLCGEKLLPVPVVVPGGGMTSQTVGLRYRVLRELGQGGFGRTYLAEDTNRFHELCVLKEFAPQVQGTEALQKAEELFGREAGILYKLQHPQIPRFRELFQADWQGKGRLFLVQDYVDGETYQALLRSRQAQKHYFNEPEVTQLLCQLLPVLDYIHHSGVIHRDLSPDNLMLRNADGLPVLIDFGGVKQAAAEVNSQLGRSPAAVPVNVTRLGKIGYAPNEQMDRGEVFPHSDLYALAATVLVLLTGKEPQDLLVGNRRQWQRQVKLSPKLVAVLNRMLDPDPAKRYQSAQAVMEALGGSLPASDEDETQPHNGYRSPAPYPATLAVAPAQVGSFTQSSTVYPPAKRPRRGSGLGAIALLFLAAGTAWFTWWIAHDWQPTKPKPQPAKTANIDNAASAPQFSQAEQNRKQALNQRREELGIDAGFLSTLVNAAFYANYPDRNGKQLSKDAEDAGLRAEWDKLANQWLDRLQTISADARSRMGSYTEADVQSRQAAVNQLNLSSRALNDLTDARFFHLFPDQPRKQNLLNQPIGQVWQSIASDRLDAVKTGAALETIKFPEGRFNQQVSGTLKAGEGKAYIAQLTKDQVIQIKLQTNQATRLSIYPPTSKAAALLEDSSKTSWSGKLTESGFYEMVVVSDASGSISYDVSLAAADNISSPDPAQ
ncbi:protein kinase domain-containing protein [Stenomitos frigidus]|uniref:non-specific serine/threonine protein kinase n=1 Tax=Stenomitos frigidus ULC18 TaxID=2107698 RepID=A0A2T1EDS2_9CYAN|nr:protein kinase [Stenomitos frigidus]PSB30848.1 serine/threonine protein kinase [Stenomitos frigidus ULC18]